MSKVDFLTPVGRLVQGDPFEAQTKNMQGQPLVTMSGQPTQRYFIAVAFKKDDPGFPAIWAQLQQVAQAGFPHLAQGGMLLPPWDPRCRFSWKLMDGDGMDDNNKPNANKPGFAGCWVLKFSSSFAPKCFYAGRYAPHEQIQDPKAIPRGYYVRVSGTMEANGNAQKPGVYVNLNMVELVGGQPSDIIVSGPDASQVFGGQAATLPPGVAPIAMGAVPQQAMPGAQMPGMNGPVSLGAAAPMGGLPGIAPATGLPAVGMLPGTPAAGLPVSQPAQMPGGAAAPLAVQPYPQILAGPGGVGAAQGYPQSQMPGASLPAAGAIGTGMSPSRQMTAAAQGYTYEQLIAAGHTDATLKAQGLML